MTDVNRQITLAARPVGLPKESDFRLIDSTIPEPGPNEFLVRSIYLSIDPYMRGRMNDRKSYASPVGLGEVMVGGVVGQVVRSKHSKFREGVYVLGMFGWQEYAISDGAGVRRVDPKLAPLSTSLGVLGMPGLTAYFGLLDIGQPKVGETVLVSGAAGAVGSLVGQIAKLQGCRVIGVAGSDAKVQYLSHDLGFDAAFNYRSTKSYIETLRSVCPDGIDVYFDNVGGELSDAAMMVINEHSRVVVCGQISSYNAEKVELGPRLWWRLIEKRAKIEGFLVLDYASRFQEAMMQLIEWFQSGKLQYRETVAVGIQNAPRAFLGMLNGENTGKQLVKVAEIEIIH